MNVYILANKIELPILYQGMYSCQFWEQKVRQPVAEQSVTKLILLGKMRKIGKLAVRVACTLKNRGKKGRRKFDKI